MATFKTSQYLAVTTASQEITTAMPIHMQHRFSANVDCWIKISATGGAATKGAGSHFIKAGQAVGLEAESAAVAFVQVLGEAAGHATLSVVTG